MRRAGRDQRGFALVAVLLVMAVLGIVGAEFAYSMRLEATAVRALKEGIAAAHLAEAAVEQAIREITAPEAVYAVACEDKPLAFYQQDLKAAPPWSREDVPLGRGRFRYRLSDEEARLNLNTASPDRIDRLLQTLDLPKTERDVISDSIQDWRDPNDEHRLNGAESEDYYLKLPVPYRARNGPLESVEELQQIRGVTPLVFQGGDGRSGLVDLVTVKTPGQVNINTASERALQALGLSSAEIGDITQGRCQQPYPTVPGRFGGRGLTARTRTLRIEAEGIVEGRVGARLTAVVQKRPGGTGAEITIVEWSGIR